MLENIGPSSSRVILEVLRTGKSAIVEQAVGESGQAAEIDRAAAIGAAHRNRDMLGAGGRRGEIPFAEHAQPPAVIAAAIGARRTAMRTDREKHASAAAQQLVGDLRA